MHSQFSTFISRLPLDTLFTITGAIEQLRNGDVYYPFRQDSDFLYLTGLSVPSLVLTIHRSDSGIQQPGLFCSSQGQKSEIILWREGITDKDIIWGSDKISDTEMTCISGIEDIRDIEGLEKYREQFEIKKQILPLSEGQTIETNPPAPLRYNSLPEVQTRNLDRGARDIIHSLRLIKTPDEIEKIRKAISISQEAFAHIESIMKPGMYEYEIEAEIARVFRSHHLTEAYPSIVASGPNTCVLHYTAHTRKLESGDLILIDAGAEYMGYASDMTRTLIVGGVLSARKRAVYDAVERVKKIAENNLKSGISLIAYELVVRTAMNRELGGLGLIPQNASEDEIILLSKKYYPHRTSHFLGLDVHDVASRDQILAPGMVLTIEPGIYIPDEQIGVRIEDDYLITESACKRLS